MSDFVQFEGNRVIDVNHVNAQEVGAKVKIVTRKVGRGKNMRTVRETHFQMPKKLAALIQLGKHLGLFQNGHKPK